jgi:hypothetical protein
MAGFSSSRFAFFKFARVNRKLPRSTHSGVECHTYSRRRRRRKKPQPPETTLRDHHVTPDGSGSAAHPDSAPGRRQGRATPRRGQKPTAQGRKKQPLPSFFMEYRGTEGPYMTAKEKTPRTPRQPGASFPDPHPLPDRTPWPPRNTSSRHPAQWLDRGAVGSASHSPRNRQLIARVKQQGPRPTSARPLQSDCG